MARTPNDTNFFKSLRQYVEKLKRRADGRQCQHCAYYGAHFQDCFYPWPGDFTVTVFYADAVACSHWEAK